MVIYQIIIVLITLMLWLTLRLKRVERITTSDVNRGRRSESTVKKINTIELTPVSKGKRKEVKVPVKRDISTDMNTVEVKPVGVTTAAPVTTTPAKPRPIVSNLKR